jgi:hypothetical protein
VISAFLVFRTICTEQCIRGVRWPLVALQFVRRLCRMGEKRGVELGCMPQSARGVAPEARTTPASSQGRDALFVVELSVCEGLGQSF